MNPECDIGANRIRLSQVRECDLEMPHNGIMNASCRYRRDMKKAMKI
jgi:hypothetical protein